MQETNALIKNPLFRISVLACLDLCILQTLISYGRFLSPMHRLLLYVCVQCHTHVGLFTCKRQRALWMKQKWASSSSPSSPCRTALSSATRVRTCAGEVSSSLEYGLRHASREHVKFLLFRNYTHTGVLIPS